MKDMFFVFHVTKEPRVWVWVLQMDAQSILLRGCADNGEKVRVLLILGLRL